MKNDDPSLQDLIVRALTGRDQKARRSLDAAAQADPDLQRFCDELQQMVGLLSAAEDWRAAPPSAEMTARIRQAVVSKLPEAPPHFRSVVMEADLGQRRAARRLVAAAVLLAGLTTVVLLFSFRTKPDDRFVLKREILFESTMTLEDLKGWEHLGDGNWQPTPKGLMASGDKPAALVLKSGYGAEKALGFETELRLAGPLENTRVTVFLADAKGAARPVLDGKQQPDAALALELSADGWVLTGKGGGLLQSRPTLPTPGQLYRLRLEHLGNSARVLINGEVFFDGTVGRTAQGPLHPGLRAAGSKSSDVLFNAVIVER